LARLLLGRKGRLPPARTGSLVWAEAVRPRSQRDAGGQSRLCHRDVSDIFGAQEAGGDRRRQKGRAAEAAKPHAQRTSSWPKTSATKIPHAQERTCLGMTELALRQPAADRDQKAVPGGTVKSGGRQPARLIKRPARTSHHKIEAGQSGAGMAVFLLRGRPGAEHWALARAGAHRQGAGGWPAKSKPGRSRRHGRGTPPAAAGGFQPGGERHQITEQARFRVRVEAAADPAPGEDASHAQDGEPVVTGEVRPEVHSGTEPGNRHPARTSRRGSFGASRQGGTPRPTRR